MDTTLVHVTIQTNGVNLHVVLAGPQDGEPILLLHGFPEFWRGWLKQVTPLAGKGYRLIIPDQRGYNLSDAPKELSAYTLDELSKDVVGLLDHFRIEQVNLVGHDWGAAVAWTVAILYPQRIKKLGILNVPHPAVMFKFLRGSPRQMLKSWYIGFFQIPGLPEWLMGSNNFAGMIAMLKGSGNPSTFSAGDLEEYRKAYQNAGGLSGMINWYRALVHQRPAMPQNIKLKMPVLVLWGKKDVALSFEMAEASMKFCENGQLIPFEQATHWVQHDEAGKVNQCLLEFLA